MTTDLGSMVVIMATWRSDADGGGVVELAKSGQDGTTV
jgi:hypothetical protein